MKPRRIDFHDHETNSAAFMMVRPFENGITIGFGIEKDGDLGLLLSLEDALRLGRVLTQAVGRCITG